MARQARMPPIRIPAENLEAIRDLNRLSDDLLDLMELDGHHPLLRGHLELLEATLAVVEDWKSQLCGWPPRVV